jgi:predicted nucleic acid-binding protein
VIECYFSKGMEARKIYSKIIDNYLEKLLGGEIKEELYEQEMFEKFHEFLKNYFKNLGFDFELD